MIDLQVEHVELPDLLTGDECRMRGCQRSFMERFEGESFWKVYHATGERWAMVPVPDAMKEDRPMMASLLSQFHEIMDGLSEVPA